MENGNNQEVGMEINYEMDTDLALEAGECLTKKGETVDGISLKEEEAEGGKVRITKVEIQNEDGAKRMGKPMGRYITLESLLLRGEEGKEACASVLADYIEQLLPGKWKRILAVGLGNRELTVDSLGPKVVDNLFMTYHHTGDGLCGLAPGVMAQTGMETADIVKGIVGEIRPDAVIVVDALAARSIHRLGTTIQLTDTGIAPGSGVGNHRSSLTRESLGIPVVAIGVPMIVKAATIAYDTLSAVLQILQMEHSSKETGEKIAAFSPEEQYELIQELLTPEAGTLCVTPKDIDELVYCIGETISEGLNMAVYP